MDFDQGRAVAVGLDAGDLVFLAWFSRWSNTGRMDAIDTFGGRVYWLKYSIVLAQLPILGLSSPDALARRLRKMTASKVLIHHTHGGRSYYGFGDGFTKICAMDTPTQKSEDSDPKVGGEKESSDPKVGQTLGVGEETGGPRQFSVAVAPARNGQRKRTDKEVEVFKRAGALFEEHGGKWTAGGKEAGHLWALIDTAKKQEPDTWDTLLAGMMGTYLQMCEGALPGKAWWKGHGYSPSKLRAAWHDVWQIAKTSQPIDAEAYARAALEAVK
jgi:hypothetical protein